MPELRHDPIQNQWVVIATERAKRPSDLPPVASEPAPKFCPFCPGNEEKSPKPIRVIGEKGRASPGEPWRIRVIPNKYPALKVEGAMGRSAKGIYDCINGIGAHEIIVDTPVHNQHLSEMPLEHLQLLLETYRERLADLLRDVRLRYIMVFKNYGRLAGASVPHPHSQVIATPVTPKIISTELKSAKAHFHLKERCLYCDILTQEIEDGSRIVSISEDFVVFCPYASRVPFEMHLMPRVHRHDFSTAEPELLHSLAATLSNVLGRMRSTLNDPPYNLVIHSSPNPRSGEGRSGFCETIAYDFHWHFEIYPRLTHLAGFEWGTGFYINPTAPETAAGFLRDADVSDSG